MFRASIGGHPRLIARRHHRLLFAGLQRRSAPAYGRIAEYVWMICDSCCSTNGDDSGSSINHRTCRPIARMAAFCRVAIVRSRRLLHFVILATAESPARGRHFFGRRACARSRSGWLLVAGRGLRRYIGDSVAPCPSHF